MIDPTKPIEWYDDRLEKYYRRHYKKYEEEYDVVWYTNEPSTQWRFDIPELGLRVRLSCDAEGKVTAVEKRIKKRRVKK